MTRRPANNAEVSRLERQQLKHFPAQVFTINDYINYMVKIGHNAARLAVSGIALMSSHLIVLEIVPGSPADIGGVKPNDKILAVNGIEVITLGDFARVSAHKSGDHYIWTVLRDDQELTIHMIGATLGSFLNDDQLIDDYGGK